MSGAKMLRLGRSWCVCMSPAHWETRRQMTPERWKYVVRVCCWHNDRGYLGSNGLRKLRRKYGRGMGRVAVPMELHCPRCGAAHVDIGDWSTRPHRTHLCEFCGHGWRPFPFLTVGVWRQP